PRRILADDVGERSIVAVAQRLVADDHLQPPVALRHPELGSDGKLRAIEKIEAEGRVERHTRAGAAEQPPDRLPQRLALDVPQRDVDGGERLRAEAGLPARQQGPIELVPNALMRQRIIAMDRRRNHAVEDRKSTRLNSSHQIISYAVFCL